MSITQYLVVMAAALLTTTSAFSQESELEKARRELNRLDSMQGAIQLRVDSLQLVEMVHELESFGVPQSPFGGERVTHRAMILEYAEQHEQASWVYHIIHPAIKDGKQGRTNDFRVDEKVSTGTAVQEDYFLVEVKPDGEKAYDGFGYDRGHLAPSADFRWSPEALSESYYYSNITPQLPGFNREGWVAIENQMRSYVLRTENPLLVVTGGVLHDSVPVQERSVNKVSIPEYYYKVAVDPAKGKGIGFLVPHKEHLNAPDYYAVSIDSIEAFSGIDFFTKLENQEEIESKLEVEHWFPDLKRNAEMLDPLELPKNTFNTAQARYQVNSGKKVTVCGTVVEATKTRNGHVFLKLDKVYPEAVFQVFISKENIVNFENAPEQEYDGACICIKDKVGKLGETPTMFIESNSAIMSCGALP